MEELEEALIEKQEKEKSSPYVIPAALVLAALIIGGVLFFKSPEHNESGAPNNKSDIKTAEIKIEDAKWALGDPSASIVIFEFSDFQCPFCKQFFDEAYPMLKENYIKTGKALLVFENFPLIQIHSNAEKAAEATYCAGESDKFWQMHDKIFSAQNNLSIDNLKNLAKGLNLDEAFDSCLDSGKYEADIKKDLELGKSLGIDGTPTFFIGKSPIKVKYTKDASGRTKYIYDADINGQALMGSAPFEVFQKVIDEELAKIK